MFYVTHHKKWREEQQMAIKQIVLANGQQENCVLRCISKSLLFTDVKMSGDSPGCTHLL